MEMGFHDCRPPEAGESTQELRPLGWRELCARLAAAQDLRRILSDGDDRPHAQGAASFHLPAARLLVSGTPGDFQSDTQHHDESGVNLVFSANDKVRQGTSLATPKRPFNPVDPS